MDNCGILGLTFYAGVAVEEKCWAAAEPASASTGQEA
jgi:hypothetical protein